LARHNLAKTAYAVEQFTKAGAKLRFKGKDAPCFNEFVVATVRDPYEINAVLEKQHVLGGLPLRKFYPELGQASLWCCTELASRESIDAAAQAIRG